MLNLHFQSFFLFDGLNPSYGPYFEATNLLYNGFLKHLPGLIPTRHHKLKIKWMPILRNCSLQWVEIATKWIYII